MSLFGSLLGNASEINSADLSAQLLPVLLPNECIGRGFKIVRDLFVFTDFRLIMVNKQGLTGSKVEYHSILYRNIPQFSVETAGTFDAEAELRIWVSGRAEPILKQLSKGTDVIGLQRFLAAAVLGNVSSLTPPPLPA
jgi:Bacterial PH domain